MRDRDFIFKRDLDPLLAKEIHYITDNVTAELDCFSLVLPEDMHLSIAHQSMLKNRKTPKRFNASYKEFEANRSIFVRGQNTPVPWSEARLEYAGTEMLKYTLAIKTNLPNWLVNERRRILRVSNIQSENINFADKEYRPHISVAYFIGEIREISCVQEIEKELHQHFKDIGEIALKPLALKSEKENWIFEHSK